MPTKSTMRASLQQSYTRSHRHRQIECDAYISISKCLCALGSLKSYYAYAACTHFACTTITTTTCQAVKLLAINLQQQQEEERDLCGLNRYSLGEWAKARHSWHAQRERKRETESATITFNIYNSHAVVPNCVKYVMCVYVLRVSFKMRPGLAHKLNCSLLLLSKLTAQPAYFFIFIATQQFIFIFEIFDSANQFAGTVCVYLLVLRAALFSLPRTRLCKMPKY